jgi:hypothetical protein
MHLSRLVLKEGWDVRNTTPIQITFPADDPYTPHQSKARQGLGASPEIQHSIDDGVPVEIFLGGLIEGRLGVHLRPERVDERSRHLKAPNPVGRRLRKAWDLVTASIISTPTNPTEPLGRVKDAARVTADGTFRGGAHGSNGGSSGGRTRMGVIAEDAGRGVHVHEARAAGADLGQGITADLAFEGGELVNEGTAAAWPARRGLSGLHLLLHHRRGRERGGPTAALLVRGDVGERHL